MIFMSQSGLIDAGRSADWDRWYIDHLRIMLSVPGVNSTQRFKCATPGHPPSLAMYSIVSGEVFQDPYYLSVRGMGEWLTLIDRQWYRRNLFDGLAVAPRVGWNEALLVCDSASPRSAPQGVSVQWLQCVGIDRSTPYRGIAVVAAGAPVPPGYALYQPATDYAASA